MADFIKIGKNEKNVKRFCFSAEFDGPNADARAKVHARELKRKGKKVYVTPKDSKGKRYVYIEEE